MDHIGSNNLNLDIHKSNFDIDLKTKKHSIYFDNTLVCQIDVQ